MKTAGDLIETIATLTSGIVQGGTASPSLFRFFINDLSGDFRAAKGGSREPEGDSMNDPRKMVVNDVILIEKLTRGDAKTLRCVYGLGRKEPTTVEARKILNRDGGRRKTHTTTNAGRPSAWVRYRSQVPRHYFETKCIQKRSRERSLDEVHNCLFGDNGSAVLWTSPVDQHDTHYVPH